MKFAWVSAEPVATTLAPLTIEAGVGLLLDVHVHVGHLVGRAVTVDRGCTRA